MEKDLYRLYDSKENVLKVWQNHDFYAPNTVVLGIDIGIQGIGICVRKGKDIVYCKTLMADLPKSEALAARRQFRASRHVRKNRRLRLRRLKALFIQHGLPWVDDQVLHRSDPFLLRYRAITSEQGLASKEALSICIRHIVAHRGFDYYALIDTQGEYPWGASDSLTDALAWLKNQYVDADYATYLIELTPQMTFGGEVLVEKKREEWSSAVQERIEASKSQSMEILFEKYAKNKSNFRRARGMNYPRAQVEAHLKNILEKHQHLIDDYEGFCQILLSLCRTKEEKQVAIFHYNRKTTAESTAHFEKKVKECPYTYMLGLEPKKCALRGDLEIRLWSAIDFLSVRTFDLQIEDGVKRVLMPESVVQALVIWLKEEKLLSWKDGKKVLEKALKPYKLASKKQVSSTGEEWNKNQLDQLKNICCPLGSKLTARANMSRESAQALVNMVTKNGAVFDPKEIEQAKKDLNLYALRNQIDAEWGIYPQVSTLLGMLKKQSSTRGVEFLYTGFLQRLFGGLSESLGGKTAPDYCVIECIKNPVRTEKELIEYNKNLKTRREKNENRAKTYGLEDNVTRSKRLRMRLWEEQGGSVETSAQCPFTGKSLGSDPFSAQLQLAHLFPDSKGGLYIENNLVLTTESVNAQMGNLTPMEASQAHLQGWLSPEVMVAQARAFHWSEAKRQMFMFTPTSEQPFPDFDNTTRTAQLARQLRRMVAFWMGLHEGDSLEASEALRTRIGNPAGAYTAAARKGMLPEDYNKDRSTHTHHRIDAAVLSCIPPAEGVNSYLYGGIFSTEKRDVIRNNKIEKDRYFTSIPGLPLPDFKALLADESESCPIVKIQKSSKYKSLGDSTFWRLLPDGHMRQRTLLLSDEVKKGKVKTSDLYQTFMKMGIPKDWIPSEKKIESWIQGFQKETKDSVVTYEPLYLNNGAPIRSIHKYDGKGTFVNSPMGWSGIPNALGQLDQLRSLTETNDRLELWIGYNAKKCRWEYQKRIIPTKECLKGLKRMGIPWRGRVGAPTFILELLANKKKSDLCELVCGKLLPHSIKVGQIKKGDVFKLTFEYDPKKITLKEGESIPKPQETWGSVSALKTVGTVEFTSLLYKNMKTICKSDKSFLAQLWGLPAEADRYAQEHHLKP